jgi:hypothetical protein
MDGLFVGESDLSRLDSACQSIHLHGVARCDSGKELGTDAPGRGQFKRFSW